MANKLHDFRNEYEHPEKGLQKRWAEVLGNSDGTFSINCFIDQIWLGTRTISGHSESYAEDAADNLLEQGFEGRKEATPVQPEEDRTNAPSRETWF